MLLAVNLQNNQLNGSLSAFNSTVQLTSLDVSQNRFTGSLPSFKSTFITFDVSYNELSGTLPNILSSPCVFSRCSHELHLQGNNFTGSVPNFTDTSWQVIDLSHNQLTGTFPTMIESSITDLNVADNLLTGTLPFLPQLLSLSVSKNLLSGTLPSFGCQLQSIDLSMNLFTGKFPSFCSNDQLFYVDVSYNLLSGTLPTIVGRSAPASAASFLNLRYNNFEGSLPSFDNTNWPQVDVSYNQFTGPLPSFENNLQLLSLDIANNHFTSNVCMFTCDRALSLQRSKFIGCDLGCLSDICPLGTYSTSDNICLVCQGVSLVFSVIVLFICILLIIALAWLNRSVIFQQMMIPLQISATYFQVLSLLMLMHFSWPDSVKATFSGFQVFGLNLSSNIAVQCQVDPNTAALAGLALLPTLIVLLALPVYLFAYVPACLPSLNLICEHCGKHKSGSNAVCQQCQVYYSERIHESMLNFVIKRRLQGVDAHNRSRFHVFDTDFYRRLAALGDSDSNSDKKSGEFDMRAWLQDNAHVLKADFVVLPIVSSSSLSSALSSPSQSGDHFRVAIVCYAANMGGSDNSDGRPSPCIVLLDSAGQTTDADVQRVLSCFFREALIVHHTQCNITTLPFLQIVAPRHAKLEESGFFVLEYLDEFFSHPLNNTDPQNSWIPWHRWEDPSFLVQYQRQAISSMHRQRTDKSTEYVTPLLLVSLVKVFYILWSLSYNYLVFSALISLNYFLLNAWVTPLLWLCSLMNFVLLPLFVARLLSKPHSRSRFTSFTTSITRLFRHECKYWDITVSPIWKILFNCFVVYTSQTIQIVFLSASFFVLLFLHMYVRPYKNTQHNRLHSALIISSATVLLCGLAFYFSSSSSSLLPLQYAFVIIVFFTLSAMLLIVFISVYHAYVRAKREEERVKKRVSTGYVNNSKSLNGDCIDAVKVRVMAADSDSAAAGLKLCEDEVRFEHEGATEKRGRAVLSERDLELDPVRARYARCLTANEHIFVAASLSLGASTAAIGNDGGVPASLSSSSSYSTVAAPSGPSSSFSQSTLSLKAAVAGCDRSVTVPEPWCHEAQEALEVHDNPLDEIDQM